MDRSLVDIYVALFDWSIQKPLMPVCEISPYSVEFSKHYSSYKEQCEAYLDKFDSITKGLIVSNWPDPTPENKLQKLREKIVAELDKVYEDAQEKACEAAMKIVGPEIAKNRIAMKSYVASQLSYPYKAVAITRGDISKIAYKLMDMKNEWLMELGIYTHRTCLKACEAYDNCFKDIMELLDELELHNSVAYAEIIENFKYDLEHGISLEDALLHVKTVYILELEREDLVMKQVMLKGPDMSEFM